MKKVIALIVGMVAVMAAYGSAPRALEPVEHTVTRVYPSEGDKALKVEFLSTGKNLDIIIHNFVPDQWNYTYIFSEPSISTSFLREDNNFYIKFKGLFYAHCCGEEGPIFDTEPYYDLKFTVQDVPYGLYNVCIDTYGPDSYINVHGKHSVLIDKPSTMLDFGSTMYTDDIVREGIEWVLYQSRPEPGIDVKFYRLQFKGTTDIYYKEEGKTIKDAARLYLYTERTLDTERDPVIAYFKPAGPLNARRIAADVDIPVGFWGLWSSDVSSPTINPYQTFLASGDADHLTPLLGDGFMASQLPDDRKGEAKWYWDDYATGTKRQMYKYEYTDETEDSANPKCSLSISENADGSGYTGLWVSGIGPVGKEYASNLPYPLYEMPEGRKPTRLVYVRDINTNEVLWGNPYIDPGYNAVEGLEESGEGIDVYGGEGIIRIDGAGSVSIYTIAGTLVSRAEGPATVSVEPGIYIAKGEKTSRKIVVR